MKILAITNSISRNAGGVPGAVRDLFQNKNFSNDIINVVSYIDEYSDEDSTLWNKVDLQLYQPGFFLYNSKLRADVLGNDADVFHVEGIWRYPHLLMKPWKTQQKKPLVCSPHGMLDPYIIQEQGWAKRMLASMVFDKHLRSVDCMHALCHKEYEDIRAYGLQNPIAIIPNGVDLPDKNILYNKSDDKKHLVFISRIHKKKGIDLLIKAIGILKNEHKDVIGKWTVDLYGWDHENFLDEMKALISDLRLEKEIVFKGPVFGEDKQKALSTADAFILPSHGEGLPISVLEAWSWELPVVMTDKCNIPEGFENKAAIEITDDVESITKGILQLMNMSEENRIRMGKNGYNLVCREFTWDSAAKKMRELYQWLMGETSKPSFVITK